MSILLAYELKCPRSLIAAPLCVFWPQEAPIIRDGTGRHLLRDRGSHKMMCQMT